MIWIVLVLCLSIQVLAEDISDDYNGKEEESQNINADENLVLRKNLGQKTEDKAQTRRMFDWFKNLFGLKHDTDVQPVKTDNRTGLELRIEKTEENILDTINRIADALEKISNSVDIQLHMMVPFDKGFDISSHHDSTRDRTRNNINKTEESLQSNVTEKVPRVDIMEPIYRIANTIEKINNNMELQLHMLLAKKGTKSLNKHARNTRRNTFEWMYNLIFGKNKTDQFPVEKGNTTLFDLLTKPYDENAEGDILEAADRIGFALERINSNLELQLHMKLDCKCEEQSRVNRKYEIHKRTARMDRDFYGIVKNLEENVRLKDNNVRSKRDVEENDTEFKVLQKKILENTVAPLSQIVEAPDDNVKTTNAPPSITTETEVDKKGNLKISRRQDSDEVKTKLLNYIYESYNEITNKIDPLSKIKAQFQNENMYKIGYIMSNIDTLEVNLKNMKKEVDSSKQDFQETKILNMLDTFMASNRIVSSLIESLRLLEKPVDIMNMQQQTTNSPVLSLI